MLTSKEIIKIIEAIGREVVVEASVDFPYTVVASYAGYHSDPKIAGLQAKLSTMLEIAIIGEG